MLNNAVGDLRTRRTRLALRDALLALIEEKGFDAIIVQDIADRAMINRVTFYKHYRDKYDLLEQTMQEMLNELSAPVATLLQEPTNHAVVDKLVPWLEHVAAHESFYRMMLGKEGNAAFAAQLRDYLEGMVEQTIKRMPRQSTTATLPLPVLRRFATAGFLGVVMWWLEQNRPLPVQQVAMQLHQLIQQLMPSRTQK
ncbi:MAG: TetR/AcrR family transcriptional regulator [Chloroflexi bacterium]|nr:TetR/AcrR family transcriptional regulator [Chloroflexota bacterium]